LATTEVFYFSSKEQPRPWSPLAFSVKIYTSYTLNSSKAFESRAIYGPRSAATISKAILSMVMSAYMKVLFRVAPIVPSYYLLYTYIHLLVGIITIRLSVIYKWTVIIY